MIDIDIDQLIPHSGNMILIDRLLEADDDSATAELTVINDQRFSGPADQVPAWVGIEYMAQTIAAWAGYKAHCHQVPLRLGFLLGSRRYTCNTPAFECGTTLTITIEKVFDEDSGLASFNCAIQGSNVEAHANLNVFQPNEKQVESLMESL